MTPSWLPQWCVPPVCCRVSLDSIDRRRRNGSRHGEEGRGRRRKAEEGGGRRRSRSLFTVATEVRGTACTPGGRPAPPAKHAKNARPVQAGGRRGVVPPGHHRRGVEGGSSPLGTTAGREQEARGRRPGIRNVATGPRPGSTPPAKHATAATPVPAGGRRGVVPPGHQTQNAERPETWQRPTRAPPHPRPNTPRTQDQYRRGVEGGSSPLGITGGSKGGRPPWAQQQARSRRPEAGGQESGTWQP
jgi:hypothetical protein